MRILGPLFFLLLAGTALAQSSGDTVLSALRQKLTAEQPAQFSWTLPTPAREDATFFFQRSDLLPRSLQEKYPDLLVYEGIDPEEPSRQIRLECRPDGIHWMAVDAQERYTATYTQENGLRMQREQAMPRKPFACGAEQILPPSAALRSSPLALEGQEWRLRLAITTTYEFTQYHGGTKAETMAALSTIVNRLNLVYERDLGVHFVLAEGMDTLIIDEPDEFVFTEGSEDLDNQSFIDLRLGSDAYDIGHVVDVGEYGGFAALGVICTPGEKALGYSSAPQGEGDLFVIDYLAHELGHQFGATHTFNGVNGACRFAWQGHTAVEPGSGHTIMAYAGLCAQDDVAAASTPWFHAASIEQARLYSATVAGPGCGSLREVDHLPPVIESMPRGKVVPRSTPFELTARVTDPEGSQNLLYSWDQMDTGPANAINEPGSEGPVFRYQTPDRTVEQVFPTLQGLLSGNLIPGDVLVDEPRTLQFQLLVRDQRGVGTRLTRDSLAVRVTEAAGPFRVLGPPAAQTWAVGEIVPVRWDVAATDRAPVLAPKVDIWLSQDGGYTYDIPLAVDLPNTGEALVEVPDVDCSAGCRVQVKAVDHLFFALSPYEVRINQDDRRAFSLAAIGSDEVICSSDTAQLSLLVSSARGRQPVRIDLDFPEGMAARLREKEVLPGERLTVAYWVTDAAQLRETQIRVNASLDSVTLSDTVDVAVFRPIPGPPGQLQPADHSPMVSPAATELSWSPLDEAREYHVALRSNGGLIGEWVTDTSFFRLPPELRQNERYEWQVAAANGVCPVGPASAWQSFTTLTWRCDTVTQEGPFVFGTLPFTRIELESPVADPLTDLNVLAIDGSYTSPDDLEFRLISPAGTELDLLRRSESCPAGGRFRFSFDDLFTADPRDCIWGVERAIRPQDPLALLREENPAGIWRLIAFHRANDRGQIDRVALEVCRTPDAVYVEQPTLSSRAVRLYPNPARDVLTVDLAMRIQQTPLFFSVFDARGRRVVSGQWTESQPRLSLQGWLDGLYILQLRNARGVLLYRGQFVKA